MKILFVTVPADTPVQNMYPSLGVAYISSYLKKYSNHKTALCDAALGESPSAKIKLEKPDVVGFTFNTMGATKAAQMATQLKQRFPDLPIICGGIHVSFMSHALPKVFDACVIGEGEQATLNLLDELEQTGKLSQKVYEAPYIEPLDKIPFPDRDLYNMNYYVQPQPHFPGCEGLGMNMLTSRGCPFRCRFCPSAHFWRKVRTHSPEYVIAEMKMLIEKYGVHYINFWDDLFHVDVKRLREIVKLFKQERLDVECGGQCHAGLFTDEVAGLLKQMNFVYCGFGMESAVPRILKYLKLGATTLEDNYKAVRLCRKHGLKVGSGFITGIPEETKEEFQANLNFIKDTKLDAFNIYVLTPYPGTPLWQEALKKGVVSDTMDFGVLYHVFNGNKVFMNA